MATAPARPDSEGMELQLSKAVVERFQEMIVLIPDAEEGGVSNIVAQIFQATTAAELDKPWTDDERGIPLGRPFTLLDVHKRASDFQDGLGFYLELDVIDLSTGEATVWVTGSVSAVAQITFAYAQQWLPVNFVMVEAAKASKAGYKPQHLEVVKDESTSGKPGRRG